MPRIPFLGKALLASGVVSAALWSGHAQTIGNGNPRPTSSISLVPPQAREVQAAELESSLRPPLLLPAPTGEPILLMAHFAWVTEDGDSDARTDGMILLVQQPPPLAPAQPLPALPQPPPFQPLPSEPTAATTTGGGTAGFFAPIGAAPSGGGLSGGSVNASSTSGGALSASQQAAPATAANVVGGGEATSRATTDVGDLLGKSINALGVYIENRSPVITYPVIRGYQTGQYVTQADGAYWFPARQDLDTIVSKIESSEIENVVIIKGPYSVRYGPGFAFIDVETLSTPRYQNGFEVHESSGITYKTNGQMWLGIQDVWGGGENYGFRASYIQNIGNDYFDGNGDRMDSGFNTKSFNFSYGYDLSKYAKLEFKAMHMEDRPIDIPGSFFDINYMSTDAYVVRFTLDDKNWFKLSADAWYNYTNLNGNNLNLIKRQSIPVFDDAPITGNQITVPGNQFFSFMVADMTSWGARSLVTLGQAKTVQVTLGADLHYLNGYSNEFDFFTNPDGTRNTAAPASNFPIPRSYSLDPGLFADISVPLLDDKLTLRAGARIDWVQTGVIDLSPPAITDPGTDLLGVILPTAGGAYQPGFTSGGAQQFGPSELTRDYTLWSVFVTPEYKVNDHLTLTGGAAVAQVPPTLTQLYALSPFLGVIQNGLNFVVGNPQLAPEQDFQFDLGARYASKTFRAGISGFYAFIHDYITYENNSAFPIFNSFGYQYVNTSWAHLVGGEAYLEYDVTKWLTPFATVAYVAGTDETRDNRPFVADPRAGVVTGAAVPAPTASFNGSTSEPLPGIPPLQSRIGFRIHDPCDNPKWGAEFTANVVAAQNRVAVSLHEEPTPGYTVFDVRSYWQPNEHLLMTAGIENLGNINYREWLDLRTGPIGVFQPGITYYVGAKLKY